MFVCLFVFFSLNTLMLNQEIISSFRKYCGLIVMIFQVRYTKEAVNRKLSIAKPALDVNSKRLRN